MHFDNDAAYLNFVFTTLPAGKVIARHLAEIIRDDPLISAEFARFLLNTELDRRLRQLPKLSHLSSPARPPKARKNVV
jgi:hypothetical protein